MRTAPLALSLVVVFGCASGEPPGSSIVPNGSTAIVPPSQQPNTTSSPNAELGGAGASATDAPSSSETGGQGPSGGAAGNEEARSEGGTSAQTPVAPGGGGTYGSSGMGSGGAADCEPSCDSSEALDTTAAETATDNEASGAGTAAVNALREHLMLPRAARPPIHLEPFATAALSKADADSARELLWQDHAEWIRETRQAETDAMAITLDGQPLRYDFRVFGTKPAAGRSLFISLHGGGEAAASVNDQQWENQKSLYEPSEGIYLAPRAPTNTWNLWHEAHIDGLLRRLVENLIVLEEVDPNRVYLMGYSAGGDGVYQLAPRMADSFAAAAMMAGHPNDAEPDNLRNLGFTLHVGGQDTAFDRHLVAEQWGAMLEALHTADPSGYVHEVHIHPSKGHWMDLEDAVAVPWMAEFTRNPSPSRVVWLQDDVPHERLYWLAVPSEQALKETKVIATCSGQTIHVQAQGVQTLHVRLSDELVDLDQPVHIETDSAALHSDTAPRTIGTLARTLAERGDPALMYSAEVTVEL